MLQARSETKAIFVAWHVDLSGDREWHLAWRKRRGGVRLLFDGFSEAADWHGLKQFHARKIERHRTALDRTVRRGELDRGRGQVPANQTHRGVDAPWQCERKGKADDRTGAEMKPVNTSFAAGELDAGIRRIGERHNLDDEGAIARRGPGEERIGILAIMIERVHLALRVDDPQKSVTARAEDVGVDPGDERLSLLQTDRETIDIAGFIEAAANRSRQRPERLRAFKLIIPFGVAQFRCARHDQEPRSRRAFIVEKADEMRADRDVRGDIDIEYAGDRGGRKLNPGRVGPDLRWPRSEFSGGGDRERRSSLAGDRVEVGQCRLRARGRGCEQKE